MEWGGAKAHRGEDVGNWFPWGVSSSGSPPPRCFAPPVSLAFSGNYLRGLIPSKFPCELAGIVVYFFEAFFPWKKQEE